MTVKGTHLSQAAKDHLSKINTGKSLPKDVREMISSALKGNKHTLGYRATEETKRKQSIASRGRHPTDVTRAKISAAAKERLKSPEARKKLSDALKGRKPSEETCKKLSDAAKRRTHPEAVRRKIGDAQRGRAHSAESRQKTSSAMKGHPVSAKQRQILSLVHKGKTVSSETRKRLSESHRGNKSHCWRGGISFEPYCPAFNKALKEEIRNEFDRQCYLCSTTEVKNGKKLCVHHCDYNKGQGCGKRWNLVPLCKSCHLKTNNYRFHYFNLLANHWAFMWSDFIMFDPHQGGATIDIYVKDIGGAVDLEDNTQPFRVLYCA